MSPIYTGVPAHGQIVPINASQPLELCGSQAQHNHSNALSLAQMSHTAECVLDQLETQPDGHHQLFALLTRNGIADGTLHIRSFQGKDADYGQEVKVPG